MQRKYEKSESKMKQEIRKNVNFGCTEAIKPFTNTKVPYKNLIPIVQLVWQLYDIVI